MDLKTLQKMTIKKLRDEAAKFPKITGVHGMKKEELIAELKTALGIVESAEDAKTRIADTKSKVKLELKKIKATRAESLKNKDEKQLGKARFHIKKLKRELRRNAAPKAKKK